MNVESLMMQAADQPPPPDLDGFLREYGELCKKYGMFVSACGCCDSPFLDKLHAKEPDKHLACVIDHLKEHPL